MSIASASDRAARQALLVEMRRDLLAAGVPQEAWPQRLPRIYHAYTVRSAGGAKIQVLLAVRKFLVPHPVAPWDGGGGSIMIRWDRFDNAELAWTRAKLMCGW